MPQAQSNSIYTCHRYYYHCRGGFSLQLASALHALPAANWDKEETGSRQGLRVTQGVLTTPNSHFNQSNLASICLQNRFLCQIPFRERFFKPLFDNSMASTIPSTFPPKTGVSSCKTVSSRLPAAV